MVDNRESHRTDTVVRKKIFSNNNHTSYVFLFCRVYLCAVRLDCQAMWQLYFQEILIYLLAPGNGTTADLLTYHYR